ncbi:MAG: hypothetical protein ACLRSW_03575 [Christensenellaceae bacterium]
MTEWIKDIGNRHDDFIHPTAEIAADDAEHRTENDGENRRIKLFQNGAIPAIT